MKRIRYAGVYTGPSYGNPWTPSFEWFTSLAEAEVKFKERQETSGRYELVVRNTMELYKITYEGLVTYVGHEPFMRLSAGPRGGIKRENY